MDVQVEEVAAHFPLFAFPESDASATAWTNPQADGAVAVALRQRDHVEP
jgi:hypothetical protein